MEAGHATRIGNRCLLMVGAHVAHDCTLGDNVILTNNTMLGGHVSVDDRAYLSGSVAVHQFCRIGRLAMVGGLARVRQDVPPFVTIDGGTTMVVGLNKVGLRRAGFSPSEVLQLKAAYRLIYRSGLSWEEMLDALRLEFHEGPAAEFLPFFLQQQARLRAGTPHPAGRHRPPDARGRRRCGNADRRRGREEGRLNARADAAWNDTRRSASRSLRKLAATSAIRRLLERARNYSPLRPVSAPLCLTPPGRRQRAIGTRNGLHDT